MSTTVSSSAVAEQEKCVRNKRKFRQDPPPPNQGCSDDNSGSTSSLEEEHSLSETRSGCGAGKGSCGDSNQKESTSCCASGSGKHEARLFDHIKIMKWIRNGQSKAAMDSQGQGVNFVKDEESSKLEEVEWDDCTEEELEDLLVKSLGSLYHMAINKIEGQGHRAEDALRAVLRHGRCDGAEDALSNIVEKSLAYLNDTESHASECTAISFSDLKELQKYSLAEMVGSLRKGRPMLSKFEAMWDLLMYDMNVAACDTDDPTFSSSSKEPSQKPPANPCIHENCGPSSPKSVLEGPPSTDLSSSASKATLADHRPSDAQTAGSSPPTALPKGSASTNSSSLASDVTMGADHQPGAAQEAESTCLRSLPEGLDSTESSPAAAVVIQAGAVLEPLSPPSSCSTPPPSSPRKLPPPLSSISPPVSSPSLLPPPPSPTPPIFEVALLSPSESAPHSHPRGVTIEESSLLRSVDVEDSSTSPTAAVAMPLHTSSPQEKQSDVPGDVIVARTIPTLKSEDEADLRHGGGDTAGVGELAGATSESSLDRHFELKNLEGSPKTPSDAKQDTLEVQTSLPVCAQERRHEHTGLQLGATSTVAESPINVQRRLNSGTSQGDGLSQAPQNRRRCCHHEKTRNVDTIGCAELACTCVGRGSVADHSTVAGADKTEGFVVSAPHGESSSVTDESIAGNSLLQAAKLVKVDPDCLSPEALATWKGETDEKKDEFIARLVHRARELEVQLQERTEWAKQKVMQAASRLSKDLLELRALKLEKEEWLQLKTDRQSFEDKSSVKVTKLENDLRKTTRKVDSANASITRVEAQNREIRAEMEAAKLSAAEVQASFKELMKKEKKYIKREQAWEKQRAKFQEDLAEEKRIIAALQQQLGLAKEQQKQAEVRWRQEERAKEDATFHADYEKRAREQSQAAIKKREEALCRKAESNYQRHRDEIQRLEGEITQLRGSTEAAQLATSRWGPGVAVTSNMRELGTLQALKESNNRLSRELLELQHLRWRDVRRERECVMCMCEEMSVVFLPCAHLVICVNCNELHQKQGMRDCPSCRTIITQRIRVFGVSTQ